MFLFFFRNFVNTFIQFKKPIIVAVNGPAIGLGASILPLCDVVWANEKAWFQTPYTTFGQSPDGCSSLTFPRIMGLASVSSLQGRGWQLHNTVVKLYPVISRSFKLCCAVFIFLSLLKTFHEEPVFVGSLLLQLILHLKASVGPNPTSWAPLTLMVAEGEGVYLDTCSQLRSSEDQPLVSCIQHSIKKCSKECTGLCLCSRSLYRQLSAVLC